MSSSAPLHSDLAGNCAAPLAGKTAAVDTQAWLADVLARINDLSIRDLDQLLSWNWKPAAARLAA